MTDPTTAPIDLDSYTREAEAFARGCEEALRLLEAAEEPYIPRRVAPIRRSRRYRRAEARTSIWAQDASQLLLAAK